MAPTRIGGDALEVEVLPELGARLHRLRVHGHDLLRTPDDLATYRTDPMLWGGYVMAPWCNRIEAVPLEVAGRTIAVESNVDEGTAIHGQVSMRPWDVEGPGSFVIRGGGDGWPWRYEVRERVRVDGMRLRVELAVVNLDDGPMPAGIGIHPWFVGPPEVAIRGDMVWAPNTDTPAQPVPVAGPTDLRRLGPMAEGVDATWGALIAEGRGSGPAAPVELRWPTLDLRAEMRVEAPTIFIVAAHLQGMDAIAVEPETHAPQGLRRLLRSEPGALTLLAPGERLALSTELTFQAE